MSSKYRFVLICTLACGGCSSNDPSKTESPGTPGPDSELAPGVHSTDEEAVFKTADFTLEPGQEKFLCYATNLEEDLVVEGVSHKARSTLHHIVFSKTSAPEPDGFSECDTLFRLSWEPLYISGAGASSLDLPEGFAHRLGAGTQIVAQLHLLNATEEAITDSVEIAMRRSLAAAAKPVAGYAFGNFEIHLPPSQPSTVEGLCDVKEEVRLLAGFPHMHLLGKRLTFHVSRAGGEFSQVFERNPYDFDDQHLETMDLTLAVGDTTKVLCEYENTFGHEITFGESTTNEMCFFIGFAADRERISGCLARPATTTPVVSAGPAPL